METLQELKRILFEFINLLIDSPFLLMGMAGLIFVGIIYRLGYNSGLKKGSKK